MGSGPSDLGPTSALRGAEASLRAPATAAGVRSRGAPGTTSTACRGRPGEQEARETLLPVRARKPRVGTLWANRTAAPAPGDGSGGRGEVDPFCVVEPYGVASHICGHTHTHTTRAQTPPYFTPLSPTANRH